MESEESVLLTRVSPLNSRLRTMPVTLALILLTAMLWPNGCAASWPMDPRSGAEGSGSMPDNFEITYRARGGQMPVDLEIHLAPNGQAEVYVGTSYSIPIARVSRVGTFGGRAPTAEVNALGAYLGEHDLLVRGGRHGEAAPNAPNRFLEIRADGREAQLTLVGLVESVVSV